jgi:hypothetical protein
MVAPAAIAAVELVLAIIGKLAPVISDMITEALNSGATAEELRNKDITVSVSFGGKSGEAVVIQREIEADLP